MKYKGKSMDIEEKIKEIENNLKPYETDYLNITCKIHKKIHKNQNRRKKAKRT